VPALPTSEERSIPIISLHKTPIPGGNEAERCVIDGGKLRVGRRQEKRQLAPPLSGLHTVPRIARVASPSAVDFCKRRPAWQVVEARDGVQFG